MARKPKEKSAEIERLYQVMAELDETPETLAERTNVSARTINNYMWGDQPLGGHLLRALRKQCDVSIDWLLTGQGDMFADSPIDHSIPAQLIQKRDDEPDLSKASELWWHTAYLAEQLLLDCKAVPGVDYTLLDLMKLAQPFVADQVKSGEADLWLINSIKSDKK